ncbi:MAG: hypothetical protein AAGJ35_08055, partial [Myxococcota bacterium]
MDSLSEHLLMKHPVSPLVWSILRHDLFGMHAFANTKVKKNVKSLSAWVYVRVSQGQSLFKIMRDELKLPIQ